MIFLSENMLMPGDFISTSEEYAKGRGVFNDNGDLKASIIGDEKIERHKVSLISHNFFRYARKGDIVVGRVVDIYSSMASLKIEFLKNKKDIPTAPREKAFLRVSDMAHGFVKNIRDVLKVGDIVVAKIKEANKGDVYLTTSEADLGVVVAFCSKCRNKMLVKDDILVCPVCGNKERRKMAKINKFEF